MKLRIAGINHNDVLGPTRLLKWLRKVEESEEGPPHFVAVEYDPVMFRKIRDQRPGFRMSAEEEWPESTKCVLDAIEDSLGYEGDLHKRVFPDVETLWLDQGRKEGLEDVDKFACHRLATYRSFLPAHKGALQDSDLQVMSKKAWKIVSSDDAEEMTLAPCERYPDPEFACRIFNRLRTGSRNWAVVIVGAKHTRKVEGRMVSLLEARGVDCQVDELKL